MVDAIKSFIEVLLDKQKSIRFRLISFFSIFLILIIVDNILHFTYGIFLNNKLSQLEKVQILKKEFKEDNNKIFYLNILEKEIINTKHYTEYFDVIFNLANTNYQLEAFTTILSSNFFFLIIFIIIIPFPLFIGDLRKGDGLLGWIFFISILFVYIFFTSYIFYNIPVFYNPIVNYFLYFLFHIFIIHKIHNFLVK